MIYRIIQELPTNSLKHAKATEIIIQIIYSSNSITIIGYYFDFKLNSYSVNYN